MALYHDPTQLNYWHAELRFFDQEDKPVEKAKSAWQKDAFKQALSQHFTFAACAQGAHPIPVIPDELYRA
jgi:hypothetical protein